MEVSQTLREQLDSKNLVGLRDILFGKLGFDISLTPDGVFEQTLSYILNHGILESELFETDDGWESPAETSEENLNAICAKLGENFSKEKLQAVRRMASTLFPEEKKKKTNDYTGTPRTSQESSGTIPKGAIIAAAAIAAVVVGAIVIATTISE